MSGLILPNKQATTELNFGLVRQPDGSLAVQCSGAGWLVQWPPMPPEGIKSVATQLIAAADQEILLRASNGPLLQTIGPGQVVS